MKKLIVLSMLCALLSLLPIAAPATAEEAQTIQLPAPQTDGGRPLMQALQERQSTREYAQDKLPPQVLSDLLWAADGVNRPDDGKRTAPSAMNWQEIDIYVALAEGLYLYEAKTHSLKLIVAQDLRRKTGKQGFVDDAPVNLIYVADHQRIGLMSKAVTSAEDRTLYTAADTGCIVQNVYLFCASAGLATVVRGWIDREELAKAMNLRNDQKIILAQTVGYPKKK
ncbi:MAG TPA: SagB/ThcOx family dehydrogenase [bacterium]|nr:SagB/ThcOx family dehydrogenase [bacterium]